MEHASATETLPHTSTSKIVWQRIIGYLKPYRARLSLAIVMLLLSACLSLVFPIVIQQVVDTTLIDGDRQRLTEVIQLLIFVFFIRFITSLFQSYNFNYIGERLTVDMSNQLYSHLQTLSLGFFVKRRVGELVSRLTNDVTVMRTALTRNINVLLQQTTVTLGSVIVMFAIDWRMTLLIIGFTPLFGGIGLVFGIWLRKTRTHVQDKLAGTTVVAEEVFQNIRTVKGFVGESYEIHRYEQAMDIAFRAAIDVLRIRSLFIPLIIFLAFLGLTLLLWVGGESVLSGRLTSGELVAFLIYGLTVAAAFGSLADLYGRFQEAIGATERVFQLLDIQPDIRDGSDAKHMTQLTGAIQLHKVGFDYGNGVQVLRDITLDIQQGDVVAFVGPSGAGKSTLFDLLLRFYDPTAGVVTMDGYDIRHMTQASLRQHMAVVSQETILFGGTIIDNIRYGNIQASDDEIIKAAKAANAHEFIGELPQEYKTIVGERGIRLSGGQRQRIAIARALLKNAHILLLDEATSSLDNESEKEVQSALSLLMQGRTTLIIAHRLSTVHIADYIVVLDRGAIVEMGTHEELINQPDGLYTRLYQDWYQEVVTVTS